MDDNYPEGSIVTIFQIEEGQNSYFICGQSIKYCWMEDWLEPLQKQKKGFGKWYSQVIG